eukprot:TRINITY_DN13734_c0_g2_i4.p1 TRINITY_DN13734_c0_g2~~TRINITY_DN13734_c0_g2_i4.p1  ORF type:complete len:327 (-),score=79.63 TRINITY_DN13734_c0_g2_i4:415-1395(-)
MESKVPTLESSRAAHINYLLKVDETVSDVDSLGFYLTEILRMAGCYWAVTALACLRVDPPKEKVKVILDWIAGCQNTDGGFGGNTGHDSHITTSHYAVLILLQLKGLDRIDVERLVSYIVSLQLPDGSFMGDRYGEVDTRFSYCALSCLKLLGKLDRINVEKACDFVLRCWNPDGGFAAVPDAESHAAYVFTGAGALGIAGKLDKIDLNELGAWLAERQTTKGGFNGRPEKLPDVCYSWWILSIMVATGRDSWIDRPALEGYILSCQDPERGGFSDRPGNEVDVYHTFFGLAGLSLLDTTGAHQLERIDPLYALPEKLIAEVLKSS